MHNNHNCDSTNSKLFDVLVSLKIKIILIRDLTGASFAKNSKNAFILRILNSPLLPCSAVTFQIPFTH